MCGSLRAIKSDWSRGPMSTIIRARSRFPSPSNRATVQQVSLLTVLLTALCWALPAAAEARRIDVPTLLEAMTTASRQLDYRGIFTYEYAGVLKSVEVTHVVRDGIEHERWFYLNGPPQEILRRGAPCHGAAAGNLDRIARPAVDYQQLASHYDLHLWGEDRIADRPVWVLQLAPRDAHRYGFVFSVDKQSGLLLQSLLLDTNRRVLERFQYLRLDYAVDDGDARALMAATAAREGGRGEAATDAAGCEPVPEAHQGSGWQAGWIPPGFRLMAREVDGANIESLLFSDGLSVFSVFFDPGGGGRLPEVQAQRGATVAQLARVETGGASYLVSVVGEIPIETAQRVAGFVRHGGD